MSAGQAGSPPPNVWATRALGRKGADDDRACPVHARIIAGGVAEWLKAPVLKTGNGLVSFAGSNPAPTAFEGHTAENAEKIHHGEHRGHGENVTVQDGEEIHHRERRVHSPRRAPRTRRTGGIYSQSTSASI